MIECVATGLVYRNPSPQIWARHAYHPSLAVIGNGELLASFEMGQGHESFDYRAYTARSTDWGMTWGPPTPILEDDNTPDSESTHAIRVSEVSDGLVVGCGVRFIREDPERGLVNHANLGFVEGDLIFVRSVDGGRNWSAPAVIEPPLRGPAFELCHRVIELDDGRWLWPTSTWRGWDGEAPNGMKAIAFVSEDRGKTWPSYIDLIDNYDKGINSWEVSVVQLPDRRLLAISWAFAEKTSTSHPTPYAICEDGQTFSPPQPTGLHGQTSKMLCLPDGRILCLYRHTDEVGLWGALSEINGNDWIVHEQKPLWQGARAGMKGDEAPGKELSQLKFGFPTPVLLPDGDVFAVFWCVEDCISNIRWLRIKVS